MSSISAVRPEDGQDRNVVDEIVRAKEWAGFVSDEEYEELERRAPGRTLTPEESDKIAQALMKGTLSSFLKVLRKHFKLRDTVAVTTVLGCAVAHYVPGEMLWVRIWGASRSGKTEVLRAIASHPDCVQMEAITTAAIEGGFKKGGKVLHRINEKLVITKDLAAILTARSDVRTRIFGPLRHVKDGMIVSDFGSDEAYLEQKVTFDWLIGTTPVFLQYRQMEDLLGARFVDLHWPAPDRELAALKAAENNPRLPEIREEVAAAARDLMDRAKHHQQLCPVSLPQEDVELVSSWASLTALLRSPVARDREHRLRFQPEAESPTDLAQSFRRVAEGLMLLGITDYAPYIARLAWDSVPHSRAEVIRTLLSKGEMSGFWIRKEEAANQYDLMDLELLGALDKTGTGYRIKPELEPRLRVMASYYEVTF